MAKNIFLIFYLLLVTDRGFAQSIGKDFQLFKNKKINFSLSPQFSGSPTTSPGSLWQLRPGIFLPLEIKLSQRFSSGIRMEAEHLYGPTFQKKNIHSFSYFSRFSVNPRLRFNVDLYRSQIVHDSNANFRGSILYKLKRNLEANVGTDLYIWNNQKTYLGSAGLNYKF